MFIHLENGCSTSIEFLNRMARICYQWRKYVVPEHADYLSDGGEAYVPFAFRCPGCGVTFRYISALLQHVESDACDEGIYEGSGSIGKMIHFIYVQVRNFTPKRSSSFFLRANIFNNT